MLSNIALPEMPEMLQAPQSKISQIWGGFLDFYRKPEFSKITLSSGMTILLVVSLALFIYYFNKNETLPGTQNGFTDEVVNRDHFWIALKIDLVP